MRITQTKEIKVDEAFKKKLLQWGANQSHCIWLDSNAYQQSHSRFQAILAVGEHRSLKTTSQKAFNKLESFQRETKDWLFGYLSYDLKNDVEELESNNYDGLQFPEMYFFQPQKVFVLKDTSIEAYYHSAYELELEKDWKNILDQKIKIHLSEKDSPIRIHLRTTKDTYYVRVEEMLAHIERGDIYEANFCQEFYSEGVDLNPLKTYWHLNAISQPPFASFLKLENYFAFSASPERYLQKSGNQIISQPIKGTAKRSSDETEDETLARFLSTDHKERSENIMITDLVRNDLSHFALKGTVEVEELCKVYTFEQVHQLISTVRCKVDPQESPVRFLKETFPMGSMTGAPKISAMKIIEDLEDAKRGLYSGAIGYFMPNGDFDFNVVIRSILYNAESKYVSYSVGGAITANSNPDKEYEECLLKAKAMREALEN